MPFLPPPTLAIEGRGRGGMEERRKVERGEGEKKKSKNRKKEGEKEGRRRERREGG